MNTVLRKLLDDYQHAIAYQVEGVLTGKLTPDMFQAGMANDALVFHTAAYMAGVESDALDQAGRDLVVAAVQNQIDYLDAFADAIDAGELSEAQIQARAALYGGAINASYWQGATDGDDLPFHPGDGGTACLTNCKCEWELHSDGWYWIAEAGACEGCQERAAGSPYGEGWR